MFPGARLTTSPRKFAAEKFSAIGEASMSHYRVVAERAKAAKPYRAQPVVCPGCGAHLAFCRTEHPSIDACGFESYTFACEECGASLSGIVDPLDDVLLVTETAA
jgi:hypothetical protein